MIFSIIKNEKVLFNSCKPKQISQENKTQKQNDAGTPLWTVECLTAGDFGMEQVRVTVPSEKNPAERIQVMNAVEFENLQVHISYSRKDRQKIVWFTADSVKIAG